MVSNEIICGDCMDIMQSWADKSVDLILVDPPYGVGYAEWDTTRPPDTWFTLLKRLSDTAAIHTGQGEMWSWPKPDWVMAWFMPGSINHTKQGKFRHWEPVLIYGKEKASVDARVFPPKGAERNGHPCPKPDMIEMWLVESLSKPGDMVVDCMCGSGTTCVAAKKLNRRYIGIDISEEYCNIARKRLEAVDTGVPFKEAQKGQLPLFGV